jgi:hypothetical protein
MEHSASSSLITNLRAVMDEYEAQKKKKKLRGLSPQANYTDPASTACRRS